jgi:hypothetical protein
MESSQKNRTCFEESIDHLLILDDEFNDSEIFFFSRKRERTLICKETFPSPEEASVLTIYTTSFAFVSLNIRQGIPLKDVSRKPYHLDDCLARGMLSRMTQPCDDPL